MIMEVTGVVTIGTKERSMRDMKKIVFAISIFAAIVMAACTPETRNQMLGIPDDAILLSTENFASNETKTSVSGTSVIWVGDDSLHFYVGSGPLQPRKVVVSGGNAYIAEGLTGSGVIRGYYPPNIATYNYTKDNVNIKLPSEYVCSVDAQNRQVIALPMVGRADAGSSAIQFKHLTAAVNVMLKNSVGTDLYVDSVFVISDNYRLNHSYGVAIDLTASDLSGEFGNGIEPVTNSNESVRKVKVKFPIALTVPSGSSNKSVQVPIHPIGSDYLTIKVYCHSVTENLVYVYKPANMVSALGRNVMLTAKVDLNKDGNLMSGHEVDLKRLTSSNKSYTAVDGDILFGTPTYGSGSTIEITDGATVTLCNVSASGKSLSIRALGDAVIKIMGTNVITGGFNYTGIHGKGGKILTLQGRGTLTVESSSSGSAAIGSYYNVPCGDIVINGATINATSTSNAAAIGCGNYANCGKITIHGGTITAKGASGSAGIGSTDRSTAHSCDTITIDGGTISATGGANAAGIGTGNHRNSGCKSITITSGVDSVSVTKGTGAFKSIGRGNESSVVGTVTVMGVEGEKTDNYTYRRPSSK